MSPDGDPDAALAVGRPRGARIRRDREGLPVEIGRVDPFHDSLAGNRLAGLLFGVVEALITALAGSAYTQIVTFTLVIVALAAMPNGLFGRAAVKKV